MSSQVESAGKQAKTVSVAAVADPAIDPKAAHVATQWKHGKPMISCRFDPTGEYLFACSEDNLIVRWEVATGKKVVMTGHETWARGIAFSGDGKTVVTSGYDDRLIWWNAREEQPKPVRTVVAHDGWIRSIAVSPDGKWLASAAEDDSIRLWDLEKGTQILSLTKSHDKNINAVYTVAFHPQSSKILLTGNLDNSLDIWDLEHAGEKKKNEEGEEVAQWKEKPVLTLDKFEDSVRSISFSRDGKFFATGSSDNMLRIWMWKGIEESPSLVKTHEAGKGMLWSVQFSPTGTFVASGGEGKHIRLWK